jgi:hypothetical protein
LSDQLSVHISGQLQFPEYLRHHQILARTRRTFIFIAFIAIAGDSFYKFFTHYPEHFLSKQLYLGIGICFYILMLSPFIFKLRCRSLWNKYPLIQDPFAYTINNSGISIADKPDDPIPWSKIIKSKEDNSLFLLYFSPLNALIIPKRCLNDQQLQDLKALIAQRKQTG